MRFFLLLIPCLFLTAPLQAQPMRWSYDADATGQEEWGALSPVCLLGHAQSPVHIGEVVTADLPPLEFRYVAAPAQLRYDGPNLAVEVEKGNELVIEHKVYHLKKMVMHSPSEHTHRSKFWPLEIELLHDDGAGATLMVSIFAKFGEANAALQPVLDNAPTRPGTTNVTFDPGKLLPTNRGYFAYSGSLTTPPCTEGVEWRLLKQEITISKEQLKLIAGLIGRNARLAQPIYMRKVMGTRD